MSKEQTDLLEVSDLLYSQLYHHSAQKVRDVAERLPELERKAAAYDQLQADIEALVVKWKGEHRDWWRNIQDACESERLQCADELAQLVTK